MALNRAQLRNLFRAAGIQAIQINFQIFVQVGSKSLESSSTDYLPFPYGMGNNRLEQAL